MNSGVPPTDRKARTGELTPPGIKPFATANSRLDAVVLRAAKEVPPAEGFCHGKEIIILPDRNPCQDKRRDFNGFFLNTKQHYIIA
jgi:hypothetical protein